MTENKFASWGCSRISKPDLAQTVSDLRPTLLHRLDLTEDPFSGKPIVYDSYRDCYCLEGAFKIKVRLSDKKYGEFIAETDTCNTYFRSCHAVREYSLVAQGLGKSRLEAFDNMLETLQREAYR
ncbi:MAG TPA: hypothetical protein VHA12_03845 [Candidatus Nanoarchaeia archaeon]|nr:hypothetical protein [Candidatus Nanoarchaeia archaeon]